MNIYLTFDYELFFGSATGSVDKCMIEPTNKLLSISKRFNAPMTFFVDVGYLIRMEEELKQYPQLQSDLSKVKAQILAMREANCDIQLHIHPHWEKSSFDGQKWNIQTANCYKLSDFSEEEIRSIVIRYKNYLEQFCDKKIHTFRAGGWCIQPFDQLSSIFKELGIRYDTSVFPGGHFESSDYYFDFRSAPHKSRYHFNNDVCEENEQGYFTEYPISSHRYSPLFYWRLYILGRLIPSQHKMMGDGLFLSQPGRKRSVLTNFTWNHVSTDGYYASVLEKCVKIKAAKNHSDMVIIGHPKSSTHYSIKKLTTFVQKIRKNHTFAIFETLPY